MSESRLKGVYGKPIASAAGQQIPLTRKQLTFVGETILKHIRREIAKDTAKAAALKKPEEPVPLPKTKEFARSFKVRIKGSSTLEFYSDWPTAKSHTSKPSSERELDRPRPGRPEAFPMKWLTRDKTPYARIVRANGEVVVRMTPDLNKGQKYWIHPGFKRYTFLERGIRKGRKEAIEALMEKIIEGLLSEYDLLG